MKFEELTTEELELVIERCKEIIKKREDKKSSLLGKIAERIDWESFK